MNYNIRGEKIEVTAPIREYLEKKVSKLTKYLDGIEHANVHANLKVNQDKTSKVEVTITLKHLVLRAEESASDMYAAIDLLSEKLERQIRRHKTKANRKWHEKGKEKLFVVPEAPQDEFETEEELEIVRTKQFDLKPMDVEEAILQMNLLGHNFFVFSDAESDETNIVYKRTHGKYGLIQLNK